MNNIVDYRPDETNRLAFLAMYGEGSVCIGDFNINIVVNVPIVTDYQETLLCNGFFVLNLELPTAGISLYERSCYQIPVVNHRFLVIRSQ